MVNSPYEVLPILLNFPERHNASKSCNVYSNIAIVSSLYFQRIVTAWGTGYIEWEKCKALVKHQEWYDMNIFTSFFFLPPHLASAKWLGNFHRKLLPRTKCYDSIFCTVKTILQTKFHKFTLIPLILSLSTSWNCFNI